MNTIGIWLIKFIGGLIPWVSKPFSEWFGKMLFYAIITFVMMWMWGRVFPTKPTTKIERVETQIINECPVEHKAFGIKLNVWKLKLGFGV
jgi:hypothetical protein